MEPQTFVFETALSFIRHGMKVGRKGWKNAQFVFLVQGSTFAVTRAPLIQFFAEGTQVTYRPHIDMCGTDGSIGTWSPSMVDLVADDWYLVS